VTVIEVCCTHNAPVLHDCDGSERCTHNAPLFSLREATVLTTNSLPLPPLSYDGSPFYHPMDVPIQTSESLNPSPCIDPTKTRSISSLRRPSGVWAQINNSRPGTLPRFVDGWMDGSRILSQPHQLILTGRPRASRECARQNDVKPAAGTTSAGVFRDALSPCIGSSTRRSQRRTYQRSVLYCRKHKHMPAWFALASLACIATSVHVDVCGCWGMARVGVRLHCRPLFRRGARGCRAVDRQGNVKLAFVSFVCSSSFYISLSFPR
jgi:hypothetical protein